MATEGLPRLCFGVLFDACKTFLRAFALEVRERWAMLALPPSISTSAFSCSVAFQMEKPNGEPKVYRKRWAMLAMFVLLSASNGAQWIMYSVIAQIVAEFYGVRSAARQISVRLSHTNCSFQFHGRRLDEHDLHGHLHRAVHPSGVSLFAMPRVLWEPPSKPEPSPSPVFSLAQLNSTAHVSHKATAQSTAKCGRCYS